MLHKRDRLLRVLAALVEEHIDSGQPVGSESVLRRTRLGVSSATVRNDFAELERQELVYQPYTSAGRVPSDRGYRVFVDHLMRPQPPRPHLKSVVNATIRGSAGSLEDSLTAACQLLSRLTGYTAVALVPPPTQDRLRHLQLGNYSRRRVLIVLVTDSGHVEHKLRPCEKTVPNGRLNRISRYLSRRLEGQPLASIKRLRLSDIHRPEEFDDEHLGAALRLVQSAITDDVSHRVVVDGLVCIIRQPEFEDHERAAELLDALNDASQVSVTVEQTSESDSATAMIGGEIPAVGLRECGFVGAGYETTGRQTGGFGVFGPKRMTYSAAMPLVDYVRRQLNQTLAEMWH